VAARAGGPAETGARTMKIVEGLNWTVFDREGEKRAACRYAIDAAELALSRGPGTRVRHGRRVVLEVADGMRADRTGDAAGRLADSMIATIYGPRRTAA
jgi:hypothetical protein